MSVFFCFFCLIKHCSSIQELLTPNSMYSRVHVLHCLAFKPTNLKAAAAMQIFKNSYFYIFPYLYYYYFFFSQANSLSKLADATIEINQRPRSSLFFPTKRFGVLLLVGRKASSCEWQNRASQLPQRIALSLSW